MTACAAKFPPKLNHAVIFNTTEDACQGATSGLPERLYSKNSFYLVKRLLPGQGDIRVIRVMTLHTRWERYWPAAVPPVVMLLLWGILFIILPPARQNFPLNDDWAFSKGAFAFARGEGLHYYHWASIPLLGQWLWAFPFIRLLGESHAVLRLSTLLLSGFGVLALYDLLRRANDVPPWYAALATLALALNPLFFLLAGTYMSDVPALALSLVALTLYERSLQNGHRGLLAAATVTAILATITRQNAIAAPIAAGVLLWRQPHLRWRPAWVLAVLLPLAAALVCNIWFSRRPDAFPAAPRLPIPGYAAFLAFIVVHTLGLVTLPVLVLGSMRGSRLVFLVALWVVLLGAVLLPQVGGSPSYNDEGFRYGGLFPYLGNMVSPWGPLPGLGGQGRAPLVLGLHARLALTAAGCLGGAALLIRLISGFRTWLLSGSLGWFTLAHLGLLLLAPMLFDRYLLALLPGALALATSDVVTSPRPPRSHWVARLAAIASLAAIVALGFTSLGLAHDWLAWNSARWELGRRALDRGLPVIDIEGGFEWDGWFYPGVIVPQGVNLPPRGLMISFERTRFPELTGRYALAFSVPPGGRCLDEEPYQLWLRPGQRQFYLVEQETEAPP